jgi:hypothetical protein
MSEVILGTFDAGDPEDRALVGKVIARLGEDGYRKAYRKGASMPRQDVLDQLHRLAADAEKTP